MGGWLTCCVMEPWRALEVEIVLRGVQGIETPKIVANTVSCLITVGPVGEDACGATRANGVVRVLPCARLLLRGCVEFDRSNGIGHDYCCGDLDVLRVFANSAGDGLLKCCVRFQVDQEEADVRLELLSKDCNGAFVLW